MSAYCIHIFCDAVAVYILYIVVYHLVTAEIHKPRDKAPSPPTLSFSLSLYCHLHVDNSPIGIDSSPFDTARVVRVRVLPLENETIPRPLKRL